MSVITYRITYADHTTQERTTPDDDARRRFVGRSAQMLLKRPGAVKVVASAQDGQQLASFERTYAGEHEDMFARRREQGLNPFTGEPIPGTPRPTPATCTTCFTQKSLSGDCQC